MKARTFHEFVLMSIVIRSPEQADREQATVVIRLLTGKHVAPNNKEIAEKDLIKANLLAIRNLRQAPSKFTEADQETILAAAVAFASWGYTVPVKARMLELIAEEKKRTGTH